MATCPRDLKYSRGHTWLRVHDDGTGVIGITDFAQDELGDVVYIDAPAIGAAVRQFERMGEIESVKTVSDLIAPVSGEVVEQNAPLLDTPEIVNQAPYAGGWIVRVRLLDAAELDNLLSADAYDALIADSG